MENRKYSNKKWVRLDNASNIFLAAMSNRDSKVFRTSAELTETVDPDLLQRALDKVYEEYRLYHSVLRRGFFWYYLEESDLKPKVRLDDKSPCEPLYHFDRRELLFRVVYWKKRVSLETFHVLSDGTGAMWFFQDLLTEYLSLKYPIANPDRVKVSTYKHDVSSEDSFARHFRRKEQTNFLQASQSAFAGFGKVGSKAWDMIFPKDRPAKKDIYHYRGTYTPDNRPRIVEMEMPVKEIIKLAKQEGVSVTIYLTALYIDSIRKAAHKFKGTETMSVTVPVNLRQFFPSKSARNFFSVTTIEYTFQKDKENSVSEICHSLKDQLEPQLKKENLEAWLSRLIYFEYFPLSRIVLRPIKDLGLKIINYFNNRKLTLAISNLGRVSFPDHVDSYIKQVYFHTIAVRPQFCALSHNDILTISFSSPFIETDIFKHYAQSLTNEKVAVTVTVNKVTEEELGGGGHA